MRNRTGCSPSSQPTVNAPIPNPAHDELPISKKLPTQFNVPAIWRVQIRGTAPINACLGQSSSFCEPNVPSQLQAPPPGSLSSCDQAYQSPSAPRETAEAPKCLRRSSIVIQFVAIRSSISAISCHSQAPMYNPTKDTRTFTHRQELLGACKHTPPHTSSPCTPGKGNFMHFPSIEYQAAKFLIPHKLCISVPSPNC